MASTNDQITQNVPYPIVTILGDSTTDPSFATLQVVQQELNVNAASIHTLRGDGVSAHLILTIPKADYTTCSIGNTVFDVPSCPPSVLVHTQPATTHTIYKEYRLHSEARREFMLYSNVNKALHNQLQAVVRKVYISAILDPIIGIGLDTQHAFNFSLTCTIHTTISQRPN
jgi:hypothetical protein